MMAAVTSGGSRLLPHGLALLAAMSCACSSRSGARDANLGIDVDLPEDTASWVDVSHAPDTPARRDVGPVDAACTIPFADAADPCAGGMTGGPRDDLDRDGFTPEDGDCRDCSAQVNPGAFDDPGNDVDEDCDGSAATTALECDGALVASSLDPQDAARALGLCRIVSASDRGWGVISARWTRADGTGEPLDARQHGLLASFGESTPRRGRAMLALSSGLAAASESLDDLVFSELLQGDTPAGLILTSPSCPADRITVFDPVALEVRVRVPTNAAGLRFASSFFTREYPEYICSVYNDYFAVIMEPPPIGSPDGNVVFDAEGNRITVNSSLLAACEPGTYGGRTFGCPLGTTSLLGTGYDVGASTGWLSTEVPLPGAAGSEITLRFTIWDSNDPNLDSLVLIDAFEWLVTPPCTTTTEPLI